VQGTVWFSGFQKQKQKIVGTKQRSEKTHFFFINWAAWIRGMGKQRILNEHGQIKI
jgi:hypothetical protein